MEKATTEKQSQRGEQRKSLDIRGRRGNGEGNKRTFNTELRFSYLIPDQRQKRSWFTHCTVCYTLCRSGDIEEVHLK